MSLYCTSVVCQLYASAHYYMRPHGTICVRTVYNKFLNGILLLTRNHPLESPLKYLAIVIPTVLKIIHAKIIKIPKKCFRLENNKLWLWLKFSYACLMHVEINDFTHPCNVGWCLSWMREIIGMQVSASIAAERTARQWKLVPKNVYTQNRSFWSTVF